MRNKLLDNRGTDKTELLLIRVGHHLWRSGKRREWPEAVVSTALRDVWDAKEALRVILRKEWLESRRNLINRGAANLRSFKEKQAAK